MCVLLLIAFYLARYVRYPPPPFLPRIAPVKCSQGWLLELVEHWQQLVMHRIVGSAMRVVGPMLKGKFQFELPS
jgi:hypothetical protein